MLDEQVQSWSGWLGRYHAALRNKAEFGTDRPDWQRERHKEGAFD